MTSIRIGTRSSALARAQTALVSAALVEAHPGLEIEVVTISTSGDRSQASNLPSADWGSGVFVREIELALLHQDIDLAVHSLKDLPPELSAELTLAAIPIRDDPLDVLVTTDGRGLDDLPPGARIGTSSGRRAAFLRAPRPDLEFAPIRGNVETRLRKLGDGMYDALVLARAGLRRLDIQWAAYVVLDPELLPPAPGQGALALQVRAGDRALAEIVAPLHDPATAAAVRAERRLMIDLDGGCRLPVGALGTPRPDAELHLLAGLARDDGSLAIAEAVGRLDAPEELADRLAGRLRTPGHGEQRRVAYA
ncbi:MAG TPA: hydroxymethylbilane synthase [Chloroflexota bacterium]|nr:hydroxymethylbilane synthase [Chloroflexota bacterium]